MMVIPPGVNNPEVTNYPVGERSAMGSMLQRIRSPGKPSDEIADDGEPEPRSGIGRPSRRLVPALFAAGTVLVAVRLFRKRAKKLSGTGEHADQTGEPAASGSGRRRSRFRLALLVGALMTIAILKRRNG